MGATGADDLQRRVLVTLALLAAYVGASRIPSLGVETGAMPEIADKTGLLALGIRPALSAYLVVEFFAWAVPRWRKLRESNRGRDVLERQSAIITIIYAIFQGFGVAKVLQSFNDEVTMSNRFLVVEYSPALVMLSLVVGASFALAIARLITRFGILNGFVALTLVETGMAIRPGIGAYDATLNALNSPLVMATVLVLPVVATLLVVTKARPTSPRTDIDIPPPASSLEPVAAAGSIIAIPSWVFGDTSFWHFLVGLPEWGLWLKVVVAAVAALLLCALFTFPEPLVSVLENTGMRRARAARMAQAAAGRALLPGALFVLVLAACDYTAERWLRFPLLPVSLALATALVVDTRDAVITRSRGGWVRVFRDPRPQLVAVAADELGAQGIERRIGTRAQSDLLRAFGPYACSEVLVQKGDEERASEVVHRLFAKDAKPSADVWPDSDAAPNSDSSPDEDPSSDSDAPSKADALPNAFAPPTAEEHERRPVVSTLELRLGILALVSVVAPVLAH